MQKKSGSKGNSGSDFGKEPDVVIKPKLGKKGKTENRRSGQKFLNLVKKTQQRLGGGKNSGRGGTFGAGTFVKSSSKLSQKVVIKARFIKATGPKAAATSIKKHIDYMQRDGVGIDGGKPIAYDMENDQKTDKELKEFVEKTSQDRHHFRFIISPENAASLPDIREYCRDVVGQMEKDLGTKLEWVAVNHHNTDNPHVHLMVRGARDNGADLVISRDYIGQGMRNRAQEIATSFLGQRTELDIINGLTAEIYKERCTSLDLDILRQLGDGNRYLNVSETPKNPYRKFHRNVVIQRLEVLGKMGLANEQVAGIWEIREDLQPTLQKLGMRNDIIKTMHQNKHFEPALKGCIIHQQNEKLPSPIRGIVIAKGVHEELDDRPFVIIQDDKGKAHYFPLGKFSETSGLEAHKGAVVTIGNKEYEPTRKADVNIEEHARNNNGIYDPDKHHEAAEIRFEQIAAQGIEVNVDAEKFIEGHIARADALAERGIIEKLDDGTYKIPENLTERIVAVEANKIERFRSMEVNNESIMKLSELTKYEGITFLDRELYEKNITPLPSTAGFLEKELLAARQERAKYLTEKGYGTIQQDGSFKYRYGAIEELAEQEKITLLAKQLRTFPASSPEAEIKGRIVGTVAKIETTPTGRYAIIHDDINQKYTVIPSSFQLEKLAGTAEKVVVSKTKDRKFLAPAKFRVQQFLPNQPQKAQENAKEQNIKKQKDKNRDFTPGFN